MKGEPFQEKVDQLVGLIENFLFEEDIELDSQIGKDIVQSAAAEWFAGYVERQGLLADKSYELSEGICEELSAQLWGTYCQLRERRVEK